MGCIKSGYQAKEMIRGIGLLALIACLFLAISAPARAQGSLTMLESSVEASFPTRLTFSLSAASDVDIVDIRLRYAVEQTSFAQVTSETYISFTPASRVDVSWSLEMLRIGGLPPGVNVEYWWVVTDASGDKVETPPAQVRFSDDRYPWRSLTQGDVTIYWYSGGDSFAQELMAANEETLARLLADTGAHLESPAAIYIYASTWDLQGALIFPAEWTGGVTYTRFSTIAIGIAPSQITWGQRAVAHELTHLVTHQMTLSPYGGLPNWLSEGLAVYSEGLPDPAYTTRLHQAVSQNDLISVSSLASPFSAYPEEASLSYAESYSLVSFLIQEYGQAKMLQLLEAFKEGSTYDGALEKVFGFDMDGLDSSWQEYIRELYQVATQTPATQATAITEEPGMHPALVTTLAILAAGLLFGIGIFIKTRRSSR
ncbi:peptidase MA family metallohydrolase [Chloroflexota bacterium]